MKKGFLWKETEVSGYATEGYIFKCENCKQKTFIETPLKEIAILIKCNYCKEILFNRKK